MMMQPILVVAFIAGGFAQPAWNDCTCSPPNARPTCGHNVSKDSGTKCGTGSCTAPKTCPNCATGSASGDLPMCGVTCTATSKVASDEWCISSCNQNPPNCPTNLCSCNNQIQVSASDCGGNGTIACKAVNPTATDKWCNDNCKKDPPYCPANMCKCFGSKVHLTSFKKTQAVLGQMFTVTASGESTESISDDATFEITANYGTMASPIDASGQGNVCKDSTIVLQNSSLQIANIAYHGLTCPASKGAISLGFDFTLPLIQRMLHTGTNFTIKAQTASGGELFCASIGLKITKAEEELEELGSAVFI